MRYKYKFLTALISTVAFFTIVFTVVEYAVRCCTGRSVVIRQIESGNPFTINSDRFYLLRETDKGKRLVRNARVTILNHHLSGRDVDIITNAQGFRYNELSPKKAPDEKRILFLGDSITLNNYLPEEETFTKRAEKIVNEGSKNNQYKFINAGVEDIGITEELEILKEDGLSIKPNVVVLNFYLNDSRPPWGFDNELGHPGWLRSHSFAVEWMYKRFKLAQWFQKTGSQRMRWVNDQWLYRWWDDTNDFRTFTQSAAYDWGAAWEEHSWGVIRSKLEELKQLSDQHGFSVIVIAFPVNFQLRTNFIDDYPQKQMRELSQEYNFEFLDLLPTLREAYQSNRRLGVELYLDQAHLTTYGNELAGEEIAKFLKVKL